MRKIIKTTLMILLVLLVSSCATTPLTIDEKYDLDNQLELVSAINKYRLMSWEMVDSQSLILQTGVSDYYLVVLLRPSTGLMTTESIGVSSTGSSVRSGFDNVTVVSSGMKDTYVIHRIYKLKDSQQAREIKAQLRAKR